MNPEFWRGKRVFITGHTGFKGSWLALWLMQCEAQVVGYALEPPSDPSLFVAADLQAGMESIIADIRDAELLAHTMEKHAPDVVIHMAAQSLVRKSYNDPVTTYATNVMGTVNLLEAVRRTKSVRVVINVTSDKCYENQEWVWSYRENDAIGGHDPYSSSKGCAELVANAYNSSFFKPDSDKNQTVALASVRAGNVIGGGDWADDRLIPDIVTAFMNNKAVEIRSPNAIRPWQHVLEPLGGYLLLAEKLWEGGQQYSGGWNFGPQGDDNLAVAKIVAAMAKLWGSEANWSIQPGKHPHEAHTLKLDCAKAHSQLGWQTRWQIADALEKTVAWYKAFAAGTDVNEFSREQIRQFMADRPE